MALTVQSFVPSARPMKLATVLGACLSKVLQVSRPMEVSMTTVGPVGTGSGAVVGPTPGASGRSGGAAAGADEDDGEAVWPRAGKAATAALRTSKITAAYREGRVRRDRPLILPVREFPKDATADRLTQMRRVGNREGDGLRTGLCSADTRTAPFVQCAMWKDALS